MRTAGSQNSRVNARPFPDSPHTAIVPSHSRYLTMPFPLTSRITLRDAAVVRTAALNIRGASPIMFLKRPTEMRRTDEPALPCDIANAKRGTAARQNFLCPFEPLLQHITHHRGSIAFEKPHQIAPRNSRSVRDRVRVKSLISDVTLDEPFDIPQDDVRTEDAFWRRHVVGDKFHQICQMFCDQRGTVRAALLAVCGCTGKQ